MTVDLGSYHGVLSQYHRKGLFSRLGLVYLFLDEIKKQSDVKSNNTPQEHRLNHREIIATLQVGAVAHIMMFIEDLAVICKSIQENNIDYYKYLDNSGDDDLGIIIKNFYFEILSASDADIRKILGYVEPDSYSFENEEDEKFVTQIMQINMNYTRRFFEKIYVFRNSHIKIYRRYKHAGFPLLLGIEIPSSDDTLYKKFDFVSVARTSIADPVKEFTTIPFSNQILESYRNIASDIFMFLASIITSKLMSIERKMCGVLPLMDDIFSENYSEDEDKKLQNLWAMFEQKYPMPQESIRHETNPKAEYTPWYLEFEKYSKSTFLK
ncbi:MAG: hypothetical protein ACYDAJ_06850 [Nitrosotalea sp.]